MNIWYIFKGDGVIRDDIENQTLPPPPTWRVFSNPEETYGKPYQCRPEEVEIVNAALYLRRPILITGSPGIGKSSLAYAVARELKLGSVLRWSITTRSTLTEGLYSYDAIGRLQETNILRLEHQPGDKIIPPKIGDYIRLGPLGTAFLSNPRPRVLLIDEIDKSDIDLPNDLLHLFEEGRYIIPELFRSAKSEYESNVQTWDKQTATIVNGEVCCREFPIVLFTSNGERDFPPAFLRRCLRLTIFPPNGKHELLRIIKAHFEEHIINNPNQDIEKIAAPLIKRFLERRSSAELATDQLLNAVHMVTQNVNLDNKEKLCDILFKDLSSQ